VVPRLTAALTDGGARVPLGQEAWTDTWVEVPRDFPSGAYTHVFTGAEVEVSADEGRRLAVRDLLADFPVALVEAVPLVEATTAGGPRRGTGHPIDGV
jgi:maltooligosyltrehalose synthase